MVEMIVVIAIIVLLTSITVPGTVSALRQGRINQAVSILDSAHSDAQRFARASDGTVSNEYYGVKLIGGQPPHRIQVTYGSAGSGSAITGLNRALNPNVLIYVDNVPLETSVEWTYQYGTGFPTATSSPTGPTVGIGLASNLTIPALSLRSLDGGSTIRIEIFDVGLLNREEF
jgi:type II secretory pathway pseudopilin PulG